MSASPKVSVVMPTYNYARFLDDAIESVLAQTFTDYELIIVDNCSTDNTAEVVQKYLSDNRISFRQNETNVGLVGNWNRCLDYAQGTYIKFLCADDKLHPQQLETFVPVLDQNADIAIVSSYNEVFERKNITRRPPFTGRVSGKTARESLLRVKSWLYGPTASMFRKAHAEKVGHFHPQLFRVTDKEYYLRLLTLGDCYIVPEVLSYIRAHGNTQTSKVKKQKNENVLEWYRYMVSVQQHSTPETDLSNLNIKGEIKRRASGCASVMYRMIPKLHTKRGRTLFQQAFKIAAAEGMLLDPVARLFKGDVFKKSSGSKNLLLVNE